VADNPDRIVRIKTVLARTGLTRSTLYRKMKEGTFPSKCASASTAQAGANPPSTNGSKIRAAIWGMSIESTADPNGLIDVRKSS
jgi:hypothetical protein